jgi:hypothetical protein
LKQEFISELIVATPGKKKSSEEWIISGKSISAVGLEKKIRKTVVKLTETTDQRKHLVPKKFRLELPSGKICNIFIELKTLDAILHRYAVSVLFRVFIELSVDSFLESIGKAPERGNNDRLIDKLKLSLKAMRSEGWMSDKELIPLEVEVNKKESIISPLTLNAYVHNRDMNPDSMTLKTSWDNLQSFIEKIWQNTNK